MLDMTTCKRRGHCGQLALLLVALALALAARVAGEDSSTPAPETACSSKESQQFSVVATTSEPLGLRLSDKLVVLGFVADAQGRGRAVERSGLAEIGDRLIAVNDESLEGFTLQSAVAALQAATTPRTLRFQTHDGRCNQPPPTFESVVQADGSTATTSAAYQALDETFDYVVVSVGDKDTELKLFAVLSADAKPPSCEFRDLVLARPFDACEPLTVDAANAYVLVPSILGCPIHQKAVMAEEAGAKGVIFVQRVGEKPLPVRLPPPTDLPRAIKVPLAMVSMDSGARVLEQMAVVRPDQSLMLRFVFKASCTADRFAVHPDANDPLRRSAAFFIDAASAGFLSISAASSASSELLSDAYEFLKPADYSSMASSGAGLPLGKHDLLFPDARVFDPCEADPLRISPLVRSRQSELIDSFVALRLRAPKAEHGCSLMRQLAYFAAKRVSGIIMADPEFPAAASSLEAAVAVQQVSVPVVFVSVGAFKTMRRKLQQLQTNAQEEVAHVHVEFTGENALAHQWKELASLAVPSNWPMSEITRDRLFHRMLKDQATVEDHDAQLALVKDERYEALVASYWKAQRYYGAQTTEEDHQLEEDAPAEAGLQSK